MGVMRLVTSTKCLPLPSLRTGVRMVRSGGRTGETVWRGEQGRAGESRDSQFSSRGEQKRDTVQTRWQQTRTQESIAVK